MGPPTEVSSRKSHTECSTQDEPAFNGDRHCHHRYVARYLLSILLSRQLLTAQIAGNGPSAMILSYILHGHIPFYRPDPPHPDHLLHAKLEDNHQLLDVDVSALTEHFAASRLSYSTQALPVNVLFDTLIRPSVDVNTECSTNVEWRHIPEKAISHMVFGDAAVPGGQWANNPMPGSWDIQTLSYSAMLSLPGYCFAEHYLKVAGKELPEFTRPTRQQVADYLHAYPEAVQINDAFRCNESLSGISRVKNGFYIHSHNICCKHLVLASGIFSEVLQPRPLLRPLLSLPPSPQFPLLVIGSGFSAADAIISAPKDQKIIHIYKWDPENRPSPLRSCHHQAYPEYAGVYRLMKREANGKRPMGRHKMSTPFLESRRWDEVYEGLPNTEIIGVDMGDDKAMVTFRRNDGETLSRPVCGLISATGRRGTLRYLDNDLLAEVLGSSSQEANPIVSGQTLRSKALENLEVAPGVFVIGSLTGDSLVRFAYGGCVQTAGRLMRHSTGKKGSEHPGSGLRRQPPPPVMNGIDGHYIYHNGDSRDPEMETMLPWTEKLGIGGLWRSFMYMFK